MRTGSIIIITILLLIAFHEVPAAELTILEKTVGLECQEGPKGHACRGQAMLTEIAECGKPCRVTVVRVSGESYTQVVR